MNFFIFSASIFFSTLASTAPVAVCLGLFLSVQVAKADLEISGNAEAGMAYGANEYEIGAAEVLRQFKHLPFFPDEVATATEEFLAQATFVTPYLSVVGTLKASEVKSSEQIARVLFENFGYRTVMAAEVYNLGVPGFDGVVIDSHQRIVANLSLKETQGGILGLGKHVREALDKAKQFSRPEGWADYLLHVVFSRQLPQPLEPDSRFALSSDRVYRLFTDRRKQILQLAAVFGAGMGRPVWLGVHILPLARLSSHDLDNRHGFLFAAGRSSPVTRIIFSTPNEDRFYERAGVTVLRAGNVCETELGFM